MSLKISVDNIKALQGIQKIKDQLKPEVINKSLDQQLSADIAALKQNLLSLLNKDQKSKVEVKDQSLGETQIQVRQSDQEIIKHLTGVDIAQVSKTRDYNTLADGKVAVIANRTAKHGLVDHLNGPAASKMSSGVNLRLPIGEADTFSSQYNQALQYYNNSMFVFVDDNGKSNYYVNPGIDMTPYVKVVCSTEGGDTTKSNNRWDVHRTNRGSADWTLFSTGVAKIKKDFINMTDVVDKVKEGDYEEAKNLYNHISKGSSKTDVIEKIDNLQKNENLNPTTDAYNNTIKLIKNLKLQKTIKEDSVSYTLVSTYDETTKDFENFQDKLREEASLWQISNEQIWIKTLVEAIVRLANNSMR